MATILDRATFLDAELKRLTKGVERLSGTWRMSWSVSEHADYRDARRKLLRRRDEVSTELGDLRATAAEVGWSFPLNFKVLDTYVHDACGQGTTMALSLARRVAADPRGVPELRCYACHAWFPTASFRWRTGGRVSDPRPADHHNPTMTIRHVAHPR